MYYLAGGAQVVSLERLHNCASLCIAKPSKNLMSLSAVAYRVETIDRSA